LDGVGVFLAHDADGGGEIEGANGLGQTVASFDEVLVTKRGTVVG